MTSFFKLFPLSQSLITTDLAIAFDIRNQHQIAATTVPPSSQLPQSTANSSTEFDSVDFGSGTEGGSGKGSGAGDESAQTLKRPQLVWTPQLHKRFVDAVAHLGIKNVELKVL
ncbi:transcription factor PCL1-like [Olea europaea subsp. europaea]|uniref:Transcription factor PCL1-like n=1 Tax=Olea europaea subsp. europaea TaxID=158383 RepID=A0A8S0S1R4_OLEEU|nr:transcription factor PCL1-like [Olea europaea subsp. europaea]